MPTSTKTGPRHNQVVWSASSCTDAAPKKQKPVIKYLATEGKGPAEFENPRHESIN